jgi:TonB-linked SusC/RagA family outer membrane protein
MTMNTKSLPIIVAILSLNLIFPVFSSAQEDQRTVTVQDESGNPISGALIYVGEGARVVRTNENGQFFVPRDSIFSIYIEAEGFESKLIDDAGSVGLESVVLSKTPFQMGEKDKVYMPFGTFNKRQIPGAVTVLAPREILTYDQTDIVGAITGRVPGLFSLSSIRGMGDPLIVVDGIPRPAPDLNLQQVEQITIVKDLSTAMMYGSQAANGVILVTTRRGEPLKKSIHFTAENGFNKPISYPQYLNAADYMKLYNEALDNDGLAAKFSDDQIANTRSGINPVRFPDESYYNSTYLQDWTTYQNIVGEASGGNQVAQYYLNLGWNRRNGLLKIGEGEDEKNDRLNMRGNINYNLTKAISLRFDGSVIFNIARGPRYTEGDFWNLSSTLHPEYYPVLISASLMTDSALIGAAKLIDGQYILGGTSEYLTNIYGELTKNGPSRTNQRLIELNTGLDFDLGSLTRGLKASVYFSFDMNNMFKTDLLNSYAVYDPTYTGDSVSFSKYGVDAKVDEQTVTDVFYYRRAGIYGTIDYSRSFGDHEIKATGLAYRDQYSVEEVLQPTKHLHFGVRANYIYQKRFIAELTGVLAGSSKFFETDPYSFSPGIGLGWILTEESFLKNNNIINYLKIRTNWAINNNDETIVDFYLGRDYYSEGSIYIYNHRNGDNMARILSSGNPDLKWEKDMSINIGFESMLLDYKLGVEASYFYNKSYDLLTQRSNLIPVYYSSLPYENYGSEQTQGVEVGLNYRTNIGDVGIKLGGNLVYSIPKVISGDELDYPDDYRNVIGKPTDAMFGLVALGLFEDLEDINNSPLQAFGPVQPGDIKYEDLNNDNVIDNNDQKMIGNSEARVGYGLTANIIYKAFELFVLGAGQVGQDLIFDNAYYWVYGDRKYSEVVRDRWTPVTAATASYPRLSSTSSTNNFINSTFWLNKNNWFRLQTVQLTYTLQSIDIAGLEEARFFLRGNNLFKVSKIKDKTDLNIGSAPQTRAVSLGLTLLF